MSHRLLDTQNPWQTLLSQKLNFLMCISGFFFGKTARGFSIPPSPRWTTRTLPQSQASQCHGHDNEKLNHRWSNIVPWEEWVHVDTIKALLLHFGGVSWACTEPSSDPSPSGALGDRLQQLSIVTSSCAHAGELLPSWKTSFCHFCDCQAESQLSVCSGSLPPCLRWASTVLPCSTATPWSCPRAFLCCCTTWPMNVHVWARGSAGAASERGWLTGDEMLGLDTCFSWSLF